MQLNALVGIVNISYRKHLVRLTSEHRFVTVNLVAYSLVPRHAYVIIFLCLTTGVKMVFACRKHGCAMARMIVVTTRTKENVANTHAAKTSSLVKTVTACLVTTYVMEIGIVRTIPMKTQHCVGQL